MDSEKIVTLVYAPICLCFFIFGVFGNLNVMWATYRKKDFHGKHGIILCWLVINQTICLFFDLCLTAWNLASPQIRQSHCTYVTAIYVVVLTSQAWINFMVVFDLMVAIIFPIKNRVWNIFVYIPVLYLPSLVFNIPFTLYSFDNIDRDTYLNICTPILSMHRDVATVWLWSSIFLNLILFIVCMVVMRVLQKKGNEKKKQRVVEDTKVACVMKKKTEEEKVMASLSMMLAVFEVSWGTFIAGNTVLFYSVSQNEVWVQAVRACLSSIALVMFSQTYYVCRIRSVEYKKAFRDQWRTLTCKKKKKKKPNKKETTDSKPKTQRNRTASIQVSILSKPITVTAASQ